MTNLGGRLKNQNDALVCGGWSGKVVLAADYADL